jgi:hypothetical protein
MSVHFESIRKGFGCLVVLENCAFSVDSPPNGLGDTLLLGGFFGQLLLGCHYSVGGEGDVIHLSGTFPFYYFDIIMV